MPHQWRSLRRQLRPCHATPLRDWHGRGHAVSWQPAWNSLPGRVRASAGNSHCWRSGAGRMQREAMRDLTLLRWPLTARDFPANQLSHRPSGDPRLRGVARFQSIGCPDVALNQRRISSTADCANYTATQHHYHGAPIGAWNPRAQSSAIALKGRDHPLGTRASRPSAAIIAPTAAAASSPGRRPSRRAGCRRSRTETPELLKRRTASLPPTAVQTSLHISSLKEMIGSRTFSPFANVTRRRPASSSVAATNPATSRVCCAPMSRTASQAAAGSARVGMSTTTDAIG